MKLWFCDESSDIGRLNTISPSKLDINVFNQEKKRWRAFCLDKWNAQRLNDRIVSRRSIISLLLPSGIAANN